jgi:CubicO group peptidase (beta-lactamase class C family)
MAAAVAGCTSTAQGPAQSQASSSSTATHRVDTAALAKLVDLFFENDFADAFRNRQALVITVDGHVVLERYWDSTATTSGNIESVGKTILSTLIGIALDEGSLRSLDQTVEELLPAYAAMMSPPVAAITLRQLLTMTSGLPPDEEFYPRVFSAEDWVGGILATGLTGAPGTFRYSSAGSHLLSAILSEATGRSALEYAREKLFDPLEISTRPATEVMVTAPDSLDDYERAGFTWPTDPQGRYIGGGGQKLTARDMARFGQLWLQNGRWGDRQLVPSDWIQAAQTDRVPVRYGPVGAYGYQVWLGTADEHDALFAFGFAGQLIEIVPDLGLVLAVLSRHDPDPRVPQEPGTADTEYTELVSLIAHTIQ